MRFCRRKTRTSSVRQGIAFQSSIDGGAVVASVSTTRLIPLLSIRPCLRQHIRGITPGLGFRGNPSTRRHAASPPAPSFDPRRRAAASLPRSDGSYCAAVGPHYLPGSLWVNGRRRRKGSAPFRVRFGPGLTRVGLSFLTTVDNVRSSPDHSSSAWSVAPASLACSPVRPRFWD